jgi:hypothetical protein
VLFTTPHPEFFHVAKQHPSLCREMLSGHKKYRDRERRIRQEQSELDRLRSFHSSSQSGSRPSSGRMFGKDSRQSISSPKGTALLGGAANPRGSIYGQLEMPRLGSASSPRGSISSPRGTPLLPGASSPRGSISSPKGTSQIQGASSPRGSISSAKGTPLLPAGGSSPRGSISSAKGTPLLPAGGSSPRGSISSAKGTPLSSPRGSVSSPKGTFLLGITDSPMDRISRPRSSMLPNIDPRLR